MRVVYLSCFSWSNIAVVKAVPLFAALVTAGFAQAQDRSRCPGGIPGAPTAYIDSNASEVTVVTVDGQQFSASKDLLLCPGDEVRTGETGRVAIRFDEKRTVVRLDGNSRMRVLAGGTGSADAFLLSGVLHFLSSVRRRFEVDTPYIVAGIDGTEALIGVRPSQEMAIAAVREGLVATYDKTLGQSSERSVPAGEAAFRSASIQFQSAPIDTLPEPFRSLLIVSDSAVDWAVYYPPIMFVEDTRNRSVQAAITLLSSGDYDRAMIALHAARNISPQEYHALQAIIAVARNRIDEAGRHARDAIAANPQFAPAYIASSYVRQAEGEMDAALDQASTAADIAPADAYVTARLAELHMIVGNRRAALSTAEQSLSSRRTPLALFIAGLARLAAWEYRNAEALFNEAIEIDPEAPLPRLGLGLAFLRQGRTSEGTWEIERAVAHDPRQASMRVWLGRAYFDEGQSDKSADQFGIAKQEDPQDPTPYLFSAMERYAANDPIGALRELLEAEARGGARRVIRSERGLNEDTAARGSAIGRVFDVLGFDQLAVKEGASAADTDPANPGAHRFMADYYRSQPLQGVAQTSELLRSRLLSPPSKTPVQSQLGEADLAILGSNGVSRVTFAEFSPLFDADGARFDASGLFGTQHTWGDELSATAMYRGVSVGVGQFHYETDGYHSNNDLTHDVLSVISTIAISPEFTLFGEYRDRESEGGDRQLDFDLSSFDDTIRATYEREIARVGFHAQPTSTSDLIGVYTWGTLEDQSSIDFFGSTLAAIDKETADSVQLQYLRDDGHVRTVIGGSYIDTGRSVDSTFAGFPVSSVDRDSEYYNGYAYFYVDYPEEIMWTLGGAFASYEEAASVPDVHEFLPKLGVSAELNEYVTLRVAYLKNVKPNRVAEQLIEPTTIAGFNQVYDAFAGSVLEQVGGGVDLMLSDRVWIGGEAIKRWWEVPAVGAPAAETIEEVYRGYLYVILSDSFALSAEVIHEDSSSDAPLDFASWTTTSVPVSLNYFSDLGLFGSAGLEFVDHSFSNPGDGGSDEFVLVNAAVGYRFPGNSGIVSLEIQNLFDEDINFQNRSVRADLTAKPRYAPERTVLARGTISF